MIANHIHDALAQVRRLQELVLQKRMFRGYSGIARIVGGLTALAGACVMASSRFPADPLAHLAGWAAVLAVALIANYGALGLWFLRDPEVARNALKLTPAIEAIPALFVGAALTVAAVLKGNYDLLFGIWMCLYGLAHVGYRLSLPRANYAVGVFYIAAGAFCLLWPGIVFVDPWPMGIVFLVGESGGGYVLYRHRREGETA